MPSGQAFTAVRSADAMIGIIGGTGIYDPKIFGRAESKRVKTPYGYAELHIAKGHRGGIAFLARHGKGHALPPHMINYRANIYALKKLGVERTIATNTVGGINPELSPGDFIVPGDFIDLTKSRRGSFYDDETVHVDLTEPYCPDIRKALLKGAEEVKGKVFDGGVYACTEGPRFETPAEIRMLASLGCDIVGMTGLPEAILARELEMCFASICAISNYAAGTSEEKLAAADIKKISERGLGETKAIILKAIEKIPKKRSCSCAVSLKGARL